jgi:hypothetical protein
LLLIAAAIAAAAIAAAAIAAAAIAAAAIAAASATTLITATAAYVQLIQTCQASACSVVLILHMGMCSVVIL